jgi:hypothetical protein
MRVRAFFVLVLILCLCASSFVSAVEINPSVESQPIYCRYSITKWLCDFSISGGSGGGIGARGPQGLPGTGNITNFFNLSETSISFLSNTTSFSNISQSNITFQSNTTNFYNTTGVINSTSTTTNFYTTNITWSEMNQTPGPQGPQGLPGSNGTAQDAYPIGSVYISTTATNPAGTLGFGTWTRIAQGRVLIGQDDTNPSFLTAGQTGGNYTQTISPHEAP